MKAENGLGTSLKLRPKKKKKKNLKIIFSALQNFLRFVWYYLRYIYCNKRKLKKDNDNKTRIKNKRKKSLVSFSE